MPAYPFDASFISPLVGTSHLLYKMQIGQVYPVMGNMLETETVGKYLGSMFERKRDQKIIKWSQLRPLLFLGSSVRGLCSGPSELSKIEAKKAWFFIPGSNYGLVVPWLIFPQLGGLRTQHLRGIWGSPSSTIKLKCIVLCDAPKLQIRTVTLSGLINPTHLLPMPMIPFFLKTKLPSFPMSKFCM